MSKEQRRPYEEKALAERNNVRGVKLTSDGLDIEMLEMEEKREQQRLLAMKEEITVNLKIAAKGGRK